MSLGPRPLPNWPVPALATAMVVVLSAAAPAAAQDDPLASCRQANDDFEFEKVVSACKGAVDKGGLDAEQLTEAYRLLGIAEVSLNHEDKAEAWFLQLLLVDPDHDLGPAVSPVYRESFEQAKATLQAKGQVNATLALDVTQDGRGPWPAAVALTDPLGRVAGGTLLVRAIRGGAEIGRRVVELERVGEALKGKVEDPTPVELEGSYQLEVQLTVTDAAGNPLPLGEAVPPKTFAREGAAAEGGGSTGLWLGIGGGGAAAAAAVVVIGGGAVLVGGCIVSGICTGGAEGERSSHVRVGPAL